MLLSTTEIKQNRSQKCPDRQHALVIGASMAGLLTARHGINGGYVLAREAGKISAFEVIQAIDGPLFITSCITVRGECDQSERCTIREPLRKVNQSIEEVLRRIAISQMRDDADPQDAKKIAELVRAAIS